MDNGKWRENVVHGGILSVNILYFYRVMLRKHGALLSDQPGTIMGFVRIASKQGPAYCHFSSNVFHRAITRT